MKLYNLNSLVGLLLFSICSYSTAKQNTLEFRGDKIGDPMLASSKDCKKIQSGTVEYGHDGYLCVKIILMLGKKVKVNYVYYKNQLIRVLAFTVVDGKPVTHKYRTGLKELFVKKYGEFITSRSDPNYSNYFYSWSNNNTLLFLLRPSGDETAEEQVVFRMRSVVYEKELIIRKNNAIKKRSTKAKNKLKKQ